MTSKKDKFKKIKLNVMLLKEGIEITKPDVFIEGYSKSNELSLDKGTLDAILYKKLGQGKQPDWVKKFKEKIGGIDLAKELTATSQSSGVTLFIKVKKRIFAINWGMLARHNINKSYIDKYFGIYTANKLLSDDKNTKIKSAQSRVNETNPVNKQRQYGANISNDALFLSMEDNEALKELTIFNPESKDFSKLIGKYNSLNVQFVFKDTEVPCLQNLPVKLEKLLEIYESVTEDDKRQLFKGLYPINDEKIIEKLYEELIKKLTVDTDSFFLFEPEIDFDFSTVSTIKMQADNTGSTSEELSLEEYLKLRSSPTKDNLENDSIHILDEDDKEIKVWSVFDCLYGEIEFNGTNYILSHGEWFDVSQDKYKRITQKIDNVIDSTFSVDDSVKEKTKKDIESFIKKNPNKKTPKEALFNSALCENIHGIFFDERKRQIKLYEDKFEVCDIFLPSEKTFIHVKYNYGASALSHLFNQGYISASAYAKFKERYASKVNGHITNDSQHISDTPDGHCIRYLIINDKKENRLSFFSKMVLEDKITTLEAMGYTVKLSWVKGIYS